MGNQTNSPIKLNLGFNDSDPLGLSRKLASQAGLAPFDANEALRQGLTGFESGAGPSMLSKMMNSEMWTKMFGGETADGMETTGAFLPILQGFTGLAGLYQSNKAFGLAEDAFKQGKKEFNLNFGSSQDAYNNQVRGRAEAMAAAQGAGFDQQGYMDDRMMNRTTG